MTEEQLSTLLRLKRHEQPPPGYFDQLLRDVHRRQRQELLRQPLWRIALERWQTFFSEHSMAPLPYAGAMAALLVGGLVAVSTLTGGSGGGSAPVARAESKRPLGAAPTLVADARLLPLQVLPASATQPGARLPMPQFQSVSTRPVGEARRYVNDARPVSYDLSSF